MKFISNLIERLKGTKKFRISEEGRKELLNLFTKLPNYGEKINLNDLKDEVFEKINKLDDIPKKQNEEIQKISLFLTMWDVTLGDGEKWFSEKEIELIHYNMYVQVSLEVNVRRGLMEKSFRNGEWSYKITPFGIKYVEKKIMKIK